MHSLFTSLGLTQKETQTYLKLLELGAQPASIVAKHVGIPRSSAYFILDSLKDTQLVEQFEHRGIKYFRAISVTRIVDVLRTQQKKLDQQFQLLEDELPALSVLENRIGLVPTVKFFEGKDAVMKMYEEVLKEKELCALFNPAFVKRVMPEYHFKIPETLRENKGQIRELLVDCTEAREYKKKFSSSRHQITILPARIRFASDCILCKDRLYLIAYGEEQISAVEILSQSLTQTQRVFFDELWDKYT